MAAVGNAPTRGSIVDLRYRWPTKYRSSWVALAAVVSIALVAQPGTFSRFSLELITALAGCLLVASLGQNLVVMVGAIDLSVPALMTLSAALNVHLVGQASDPTAFAVSIGAGLLIGAFNGALVGFLRLNSLIVTFATNAIVAASLTAWLGLQYSSSGRSADWLRSVGHDSVLHISTLFLLALLLAVVMSLFLSSSRAGKRVAAVGANRGAARALGARVGLITMASFAVAGALYALAGLFVAGLVDSPNPSLGASYQLTTITVVAIAGTAFAGGASSVASLVAAALMLQVLAQVMALQNFSPGTLNIVQGVLLVAAVSLNTWARMGRDGFRRLKQTFGTVRTG